MPAYTWTNKITGTNDAPVITSGAQSGSITELANTSCSGSADTASGTITFTDLVFFYTLPRTLTPTLFPYTTLFRSDALSPDSTNGATGSLGWHFSVTDGSLDFLAAGE